jgi:hypothetical protein
VQPWSARFLGWGASLERLQFLLADQSFHKQVNDQEVEGGKGAALGYSLVQSEEANKKYRRYVQPWSNTIPWVG